MKSSSGYDGHCARCGCSNDNHIIEPCQAYVKDRKTKKMVPCQVLWSRCTTFGHSIAVQFIDCYRCPDHPGAAPFHGTDPDVDDDDKVPTADEMRIPWPTVVEGLSDQLGNPWPDIILDTSQAPAGQGHGRQLSQDSIDPLQEEDSQISFQAVGTESQRQRYRTLSQESIDPLQSDEQVLSMGLERLQLQDPSLVEQMEEPVFEPIYVEPFVRENRPGLWFYVEGVDNAFQTERTDWVLETNDLGEDYWTSTVNGVQYWTWSLDGGGLETKGKGKDTKGKGKDTKGKGKDTKGKGKDTKETKGKSKGKETKDTKGKGKEVIKDNKGKGKGKK